MQNCDIQVEIDTGIVQGAVETVLDKSIDKFIAIPYAESPSGHLRFKKPIPISKWNGIKSCTTFPCAPWQNLLKNFETEHSGESVWNPVEQQDENCLYLNIWRRKLNPDCDNRPVMVWFYGGGFVSGSASLDIYDGSVLASQSSVLVVSVNYRIGSLGFLYLDENEASGNQGMWDQLLAMKWIHKNIRRFGGDPHNITLFGESAGAVSVSCHLFSPYSAPYFNKVIIQSGCALNYWAVLNKDEMKRRSLQLCQNLGLDLTKSPTQLLKELQSLPPHLILEHDWVCNGALQYPWTPIIDEDFLPDAPETLLNEQKYKKCPVIIGNTEDEGSYFLLYEDSVMNYVKQHQNNFKKEDFQYLIKLAFSFYPNYPRVPSGEIINEIVNQYYPQNKSLSPQESLVAVSQSVGHCQLTHHTLQLVRLLASGNRSVHLYHFNYRSENDPWPSWTGVKHADEIQYIFGAPLVHDNYTEFERQLAVKMMSWWTTFAEVGKPTCETIPEWLPFDNDREMCLHIGSHSEMKRYHLTDVYNFWHKIYTNYEKN